MAERKSPRKTNRGKSIRGTRRDASSIEARKAKFLEHFENCGSITEAAKHVPIERKLHYLWMKKDPEYVKAFREADERVTDRLEEEAIRRAMFGVQKPVGFHEVKSVIIHEDGTKETKVDYQPWGTIHEFSDRLCELLLKGRRPDKYKDRMHHSLDDIPGVPVALTVMVPKKED